MDNEEIIISNANSDDWEPAMELAWRVFLKYEAPEYGDEGTKHFLDFISDEKMFKMFTVGEYKLAVAKDGEIIVGIVSLRNGNHVSLLFVDEAYHKKGIGRKLLAYAQSEFLHPSDCRLSVNAAPYAIDFYKKVGFTGNMELQKADGITFLPMMCFERIEV